MSTINNVFGTLSNFRIPVGYFEPSLEESWQPLVLGIIAASGVVLATYVHKCNPLIYRKICSYPRLRTLSKQNDNNISASANLLWKRGILTSGNSNTLLQSKENSYFIKKVLSFLQSTDALTQTNYDLLIQNREHVEGIYRVLSFLQNKGALTKANCNALLQNREHTLTILRVLSKLQEIGVSTRENCNALLQNAEHAISITKALNLLKEVGFLTKANCNALLRKIEHATSIVRSLDLLNQANISSHVNGNPLIRGARGFINSCRRRMGWTGILTQTNFNQLLQSATYADGIANVLDLINNVGTLTQTNFSQLLQHARHADNIASVLSLSQRLGVLTKAICNKLLLYAGNARVIRNVLSLLQSAGILTQRNCNVLLQNAGNAGGIFDGILMLQTAGLLTQGNCDLLFQDVAQASFIANALIAAEGRLAQPLQVFQPFRVDSARLTDDSINYLLNYYRRIKAENRLPNIKYINQAGIDLGGLTRDFITRLFKAISEKSQRLTDVEDFTQEALEAIGTIFAYAIRSGSFTVGQCFSPHMFKTLRALLQHNYIPSECSDFAKLDNEAYVEAMKIHLQSKFPAFFRSEDDVVAFLDGSRVPDGVDVEMFNQPLFARAIIANAMRRQLLSLGVRANQIRGYTAKSLSQKIQGAISTAEVLNALEFRSARNGVDENFKAWIRGLDLSELKKFVWGVTGSETLFVNTKLTIEVLSPLMPQSRLPTYHTCSKTVKFPAYSDRRVLREKLNRSLQLLDEAGVALA